MRSKMYKFLRLLNDLNAIKKGKMGRRMGRRLAGRISGKGIGRLFK